MAKASASTSANLGFEDKLWVAADKLPVNMEDWDYSKVLKTRIQAGQVKAALSVNRELIALYWHIGRSIVERQRAESWGKAVVERLATDLQDSFPGLEGFSARNIWHMRSFYLAYEPKDRKLKQVVSESGREELARAARELELAILPRAVSEIPWGHRVATRCPVKPAGGIRYL